jgi:uncharacterized protein (TIGR02466 family)
LNNNKVERNGMAALFASPVFMSKVTDSNLLDNVVDAILNLRNKGTGVQRFGSWVTRDDLQTLPEFKELTDILMEEVSQVLDTLTIKRDSHQITCMWANIATVGSSHMTHIHPNSMFSGVIYLKTPRGSAPTIFSDPRPAAGILEPNFETPNPALIGARWSTLGERGELLIFPSWLPHSVDPVPPTDEERISLSFNIMIKSKIDTFTGKLDLK